MVSQGLLRQLCLLVVAVSILGLGPSSAEAVVVIGNAAGNTTNPNNGSAFDNVGVSSGSGAVYIGSHGGEYWALSAWHVVGGAASTVTFGSTSYTIDQKIQLVDPNNNSVNTDIALIKFSGTPDAFLLGLPALQISATTPTNGSEIVMVGKGYQRQADLNYWWQTINGGGNNDTWEDRGTDATPPGSGVELRSGYKLSTSNPKAWGTNEVDGTSVATYNALPMVPTTNELFYVTFDEDGGPNEGQVTRRDSGGAAFYFNGSDWELAGIALLMGTYDTQGTYNPPGDDPPTTWDETTGTYPMYGNRSYYADLSVYRDQILSVVPEPSAGLLAAGMGLGMMAIQRRLRVRRPAAR